LTGCYRNGLNYAELAIKPYSFEHIRNADHGINDTVVATNTRQSVSLGLGGIFAVMVLAASLLLLLLGRVLVPASASLFV